MELKTNGCPQNICNYCVANEAQCIGINKCLVYSEIKSGSIEGKLFSTLTLGDE